MNAAELPPGVAAVPADQGYDGQFYYRQAISPLSVDRSLAGISFDAPALRFSRVLYPTLVWVVSGGDREFVPWAMVIVNVLACGAIAFAGADLATRAGRHPAFGLLFLLIPGLLYGLTLDLADCVALALSLTAIDLYLRRRYALVAVVMAGAILTRESTLAVLAAMLIDRVIDTLSHTTDPDFDTDFDTGSDARISGALRGARATVTLAAIPAAVAVVWQYVVHSRFGQFGWFDSGGENITVPFRSAIRAASRLDLATGDGKLRLILYVSIIAITACSAATVVVAVTAARTSSGHRPPRVVVIGLAVGAAIFVSLGENLMNNHHNFGRSATELCTFATLGALWCRGRWASISVRSAASIGVVLACWTVWANTPPIGN